jgi:ATP-binding cassette subfamily F protein uup
MDRLVDHLFVFEGNGRVRDFPGNYSQYREELRSKEAAFSPAQEVKRVEESIQEKPKKKLSYNEQREFQQLGSEIAALEAERKNIYTELETPGLSYERLEELTIRVGQLNETIDTKEFRWLELSENF